MRFTRPDPTNVAILLHDGMSPFEFALTHELLVRTPPGPGVAGYRCRTVALGSKRVRGLAGMEIVAEAGPRFLARAGTVIVPGWPDPAAAPPAATRAALRRAHARGARIVSICTGAFVLGHAGLLDGRRATTHWLHLDAFARAFPKVAVEPNALYVDLGDVLTSAGNAAGIDALLHMIRVDFGGAAANAVARRVVVQPHREGGQAQYVETPVQTRPGLGPSAAIAFARARLDRPIAVAEMARAAALSERGLARKFRAALGLSPAAWLRRERVARARELLEASAFALPEIARQCGFPSPETFRAAFKRLTGVAPAGYRRRFAAQPRGSRLT